MTLAEVLMPIGVDEFLTDYVGRRYLLIRGTYARFRNLIPRHQLNEALSSLRVSDERAFLVKNAQKLARAAYVHISERGNGDYLNGAAVSRYLADGATLVVNQIDELFADVRSLAEACEEVFQVYVSANLYAGWRRDNAFDVHWDRHDTLILQLNGRKYWKVWEPTRVHPLPGERVESPTASPVWQGTLEEGDVLYMPRGWWHVAFPIDEPTLHITFAIKLKTGKDFLAWMVDQLSEVRELRMDVPHWRDASDQVAWTAALRDACTGALTPAFFEAYMQGLSDAAHARPIIRLPERRVVRAAIGDLTPIRLSRGRRLHLRQSGSGKSLSFATQGQVWQCHECLAPALALLSHVRPCTLSDMRRTLDAKGRPLLWPFIESLVSAGVLWADTAHDPQPVGDVEQTSSSDQERSQISAK